MEPKLETLLDLQFYIQALITVHGNLPLYIYRENLQGKEEEGWQHPTKADITLCPARVHPKQTTPFIGIM